MVRSTWRNGGVKLMQHVSYLIASRPAAVTCLLSVGALLLGEKCPQSYSYSCSSATNMERLPRVLSIQSHVVSGYVGNKSATFPLQVLGFEVDGINTVQFSNHSGYGFLKGQSLTEEDLGALSEGLAHNGLDGSYTHVLTGYNRSRPFLLRLAGLIAELRSKNPGLIYYCDPVMGDTDRGMYVPKDLLEVYHDSIIPLADVITPNQFEVEQLFGKPVQSIDTAWEAIVCLHNLGPKIVVVSSFEISGDDSLYCLGSMKTSCVPHACIVHPADGKIERIILSFPKLPEKFTGTGDLFTALLLAWMWRTNQNLKKSLEYTIASLQAVLEHTIEGGPAEPLSHPRELKLIQSKNDFENPKVKDFAKYVQH